METIENQAIEFVYDDGVRAEAGYKGNTGDCVVRSIAIATGRPYKSLYRELAALQGEWTGGVKTGRKGINTHVYRHWLTKNGFVFIQTMSNDRERIHVAANELPGVEVALLELSKHMTVVKRDVLHDTYDCSRGGTRMVYGMWIHESHWAGFEPMYGKRWLGRFKEAG